MIYPSACIIQFAKAPLPGRVKTRLQPVLGESGCVALHKALLEGTFRQLSGAGVAAYELCVTEGGDDYFATLAAGAKVHLSRQQGDDLGERMYNAFVRVLQRYRYAVLIGSDCPGINADYLTAALAHLEQGCDAVFGPALDGGYVLVGLQTLRRELFTDMPWGTSRIMEYTRRKLLLARLSWAELTALADVDEEADLKLLENCDDFLRICGL